MEPFPENVFDLPDMREQIHVFDDRKHAGEILSGMLQAFQGPNAILLGIPAGGLPVAVAIREKTGVKLDGAVVSKITLPWNTEAGYGAVAFDGTVRLNEAMLVHIRLSEEQILAGKESTLNKVNRRVKILRGGSPFQLRLHSLRVHLGSDVVGELAVVPWRPILDPIRKPRAELKDLDRLPSQARHAV